MADKADEHIKFAKRKKIALAVLDWLDEHELGAQPMQVIVALDELGYLRREPDDVLCGRID